MSEGFVFLLDLGREINIGGLCHSRKVGCADLNCRLIFRSPSVSNMLRTAPDQLFGCTAYKADQSIEAPAGVQAVSLSVRWARVPVAAARALQPSPR